MGEARRAADSRRASSRAILKAGSHKPEWRTRRVVTVSARFAYLCLGRSGPPLHHAYPRTKIFDFTVRAVGIAGETAATPMPDQQMAEEGPFLLRNKFHQILLHFFCRRFSSQSKPARKAAHVGI